VRTVGSGLSAASRGLPGDAGAALGILGAIGAVAAELIDGGVDPVAELQRVAERAPVRNRAASKIQDALRARFGADAASVYTRE